MTNAARRPPTAQPLTRKCPPDGHIAQWKTDSSSKYTYTSEPFATEDKAGKIVVTSHLVGNFPGSPVDLRYFFVLDGDKIASLEIVL
jgi:hypothetical protein